VSNFGCDVCESPRSMFYNMAGHVVNPIFISIMSGKVGREFFLRQTPQTVGVPQDRNRMQRYYLCPNRIFNFWNRNLTLRQRYLIEILINELNNDNPMPEEFCRTIQHDSLVSNLPVVEDDAFPNNGAELPNNDVDENNNDD
jgi:hypothetical protein